MEMSVVVTLWVSLQGDPVFPEPGQRVTGHLLTRDDHDLQVAGVGSTPSCPCPRCHAGPGSAGPGSPWQAARVRLGHHEEARDAQHPDIAGEVVDAIIDETTIEPSERHRPARPPSPRRPPEHTDSAAAVGKNGAVALRVRPHPTAGLSPSWSCR